MSTTHTHNVSEQPSTHVMGRILTVEIINLEPVGVRAAIINRFKGVFAIWSRYFLGLVFNHPLDCSLSARSAGGVEISQAIR